MVDGKFNRRRLGWCEHHLGRLVLEMAVRTGNLIPNIVYVTTPQRSRYAPWRLSLLERQVGYQERLSGDLGGRKSCNEFVEQYDNKIIKRQNYRI